jgi:hypothetical protein
MSLSMRVFGADPKIDQHSQTQVRGAKVVQNLRSMFDREGANGFEFYGDGAESYEVRHVGLLQR